MQKYIPLGLLLFMGILSIYFYYMYYPIHRENKDFFFIYLGIISVLYFIYKLFSGLIAHRKTEITGSKLIMSFVLQLFIVCICFFAFFVGNASYGFALFFKVIFFLLLVSLLWGSFYCLGANILRRFSFLGIEQLQIRVMTSIALGFTVFMMGVFICMSFSLYNAQAIILLLLFTSLVGYKDWMSLLGGLRTPLKTYTHATQSKASFEQKYNPSLIIDEIHYIIITFLVSVNLVSVYRPFPIGWDDLGAYMNHPKLLSGAGEHIALGKMYLWELYTGIGFLFGSQTFAFYLNSFSGVIAAIVIYLGISTIVKKKESTFDLGLFSSMILLMMPMVVFQLAKDMKLDLGLLAISVVALSLFYSIIFSKEKQKVGVYVLLGIFIGVAFAIKVTSLLLLLGVIGGLFYKKYSLGGFIGFLCMFVGVFSYLSLWSMMNVVMSGNNESLKIFSIISVLLGAGIFLLNHLFLKQKGEYFLQFSLKIGAIIFGFIIALFPWGIKHVGELSQDVGLSAKGIVLGHSDIYRPDYSSIHSQSEIIEIENKKRGMSEKGITKNEDFGRYFGYEQGVNNYLKLPWNLSFQVNQKGEFTDITYIFFALVPALLLFLPYRKEIYRTPVIVSILLLLSYFIPGPISTSLTHLFSFITLPQGYGIIGGFLLIPLIYFHLTLDRSDRISRIFLVNLAFTTVYVGLWVVSAFGIVWYGILMYFLFLIMITLCLLAIESKQSVISRYSTYVVLGIVWIYVLQSAIPHGITNLRSAGYQDYKLGGMSEEVALMSFHPEYFNILFELNIAEENQQDMFVKYRNNLLSIVDATEVGKGIIPQIQSIKNMSSLNDVMRQLVNFDLQDPVVNSQVENLRQDLYNSIIYASGDMQNKKTIYRVGTFLKYYISENNTRIFDDSLLKKFDDYIYDTNSNTSIQRFKNLGISYILLDINAATIDNDPERNLTQRYENMLDFITNPKLELIGTDSTCLQIALDTYALDGNKQQYKNIAGVNYSYKMNSREKKKICTDHIAEIIRNTDMQAKYPYLAGYIQSLKRANIDVNDEDAVKEALARSITNGYKVLLKIK